LPSSHILCDYIPGHDGEMVETTPRLNGCRIGTLRAGTHGNGTATTVDNDYIAKTGTLTFNPGETTKTITIEVKADNKKESDETFYLDLINNSSNSLLSKFRGIGTIWNDD
jgi:Calx-beta domain